MDAAFDPEPSEEERRAILAALEALDRDDAAAPAAWTEDEEP
jgi:hypothetical protein